MHIEQTCKMLDCIVYLVTQTEIYISSQTFWQQEVVELEQSNE